MTYQKEGVALFVTGSNFIKEEMNNQPIKKYQSTYCQI